MNDTEIQNPFVYDAFGGQLDWVTSYIDFTDDPLSTTSDTLSPDFDSFDIFEDTSNLVYLISLCLVTLTHYQKSRESRNSVGARKLCRTLVSSGFWGT
jgi:hypothetical protein